MIVIAHVSDLHIDSDRRSVERAEAVMAYLEDLPHDLDAVLVTGDIADHGLPSEYEEVRRLLTSRHPVLVCPGNHDERAAFREHLLGRPAAPGPVNQVHHAPGFTLALCDSSVPGKDHGHLEDETLTWLDDVLTQATTPVLVAFHHPPTTLNMPYVDGIRLLDERPLADLTARHPHLTAFLTGHAHTPAATTFAGLPLLVAPGVVSTSRLPWEHRAHPDDHVHLDLPPALAFHVLDADGRLTTHYRSVIV
ncbi:metallophosphoesterase [Streptomyces sp. R41]|uniref:Metallophosphoesterase n=1 Tax=Streptomyces sp. R41 TaxID=3238632 RepID=A0AB39RFR3_9ACTN